MNREEEAVPATPPEAELPMIDMIARITGVDLSVQRDLGLRPLGESERVIATLSENLQKMYCLLHDITVDVNALEKARRRLICQHELSIDDSKPEGSDELWKQLETATKHLSKINIEKTVLDYMFKTMLQAHFSQYFNGNIEIRKDFKVALTENDAPPKPFAYNIIITPKAD